MWCTPTKQGTSHTDVFWDMRNWSWWKMTHLLTLRFLFFRSSVRQINAACTLWIKRGSLLKCFNHLINKTKETKGQKKDTSITFAVYIWTTFVCMKIIYKFTNIFPDRPTVIHKYNMVKREVTKIIDHLWFDQTNESEIGQTQYKCPFNCIHHLQTYLLQQTPLKLIN